MSEIRIERLTGNNLKTRLPALARLRIQVFHDFPYLYDGSLDYEKKYLETYAAAEGSIVVGALDGDKLVGAATALPFKVEPPALTDPLRDAGYDIDRLFYFGESVLNKAYRGRGIGVRFFEEREGHARSFGTYDHAIFCGVVRPEDHPRRSEGYVPLDRFWGKRGYRKLDGVIGHISWRDLDEMAETPKPMQFWIKAL
jgi:GNAT superfamily N-acetyltransferase